MALLEKYRELVDLARQYGATVSDEGNVLRVRGEVPSGALKDSMWEIYDRIDPNFKSNDLILDVNVNATEGGKVKVVTRESNLNIRKGPGTDQPIVGKAAHGDVITLISKANDQWWLVRDNDGEEGYCYSQYLESGSFFMGKRIFESVVNFTVNIPAEQKNNYICRLIHHKVNDYFWVDIKLCKPIQTKRGSTPLPLLFLFIMKKTTLPGWKKN